jgi:adenine-specific DNA-methyltransferase
VKDSKGQETTFELTRTGAIEAVKKREQTKGHFISVLRGFGTVNQMRIMLDGLGIKFSYPKPVNLIAYLIDAFTNDDDLVLDSFAGSGTTGHAVLQLNREKGSNRRFILIELEETTCRQALLPRLRAVVDGHAGVDLQPHGGGFRFYRLAPSLLERDQWGNWVVNKKYNAVMLAEAMCKIEGFRYEPDPDTFWLHGRSTESDHIYVTTQNLSREQLTFIGDQVGKDRTLLICCGAFRGDAKDFPNLTLKKIPQTVLSKCEWGRDDYSLNVQEMPAVQAASDAAPSEGGSTPKRKRKPAAVQELSLFPVRPAGGDS